METLSGALNQPLVSVVIPCYNAVKYIGPAIDSVFDQSHNHLQVIVVNDGSEDDSESIINGYGSKVDSLVQKNGGISSARNAGLKKAEGDFIAFLDADDLWSADSLAARLSYLQSHADVDFVYGKMEAFFDDLTDLSSSVLPEASTGRLAGCMLIRTESFFKVGFFDESLRVGETIDWVLRSQEAGLIGHEIDRLVLLRRVHETNTVKQEEELKQQYINVLRASFHRRKQTKES